MQLLIINLLIRISFLPFFSLLCIGTCIAIVDKSIKITVAKFIIDNKLWNVNRINIAINSSASIIGPAISEIWFVYLLWKFEKSLELTILRIG